ncbi:MAG: ABC transporter permease [Pseudomonadota bacterium]|nr:ABC transporter permease [Pseudomonadota bacterium]
MATVNPAAEAGAASSPRVTVSQTYWSLVWRRFRRSWMGMTGAAMILLLLFLAVFANFLSPYDPTLRHSGDLFLPPQTIHFFDAGGDFHLRPFVYPYTLEFDPNTFESIYTQDTGKPCPLYFFVDGWQYTLFGISMDQHLIGPAEGCTAYLLGTDNLGRDMLSRMLVGSRLTLTMALLVVAITISIGTTIGIMSGYFGGRFDHWTQRLVELVLAFPELPLYMALVAILPKTADPLRTFMFLALILSALKWAQMSREVRGKTLSISRVDFIKAAESLGASDSRILFRHILPNVMTHVIVATTLLIPGIVLIESFLSFLGLGIQPPLISWGLLLNAAQDFKTIGAAPWMLSPVVLILIAVLGFNAFGDGLRDAIDPYAH